MMRKRIFSTFTALTFIIFVIGSYVIVAQTQVSGDWKATAKSDGKIHISFDKKSAGDRKNRFGSTYDYEDFQGLTQSQTQGGRVNFSLVREAGTIDLEGEFADGSGKGTYRFTPNQGFIDGMRSRGFDFEVFNGKFGKNTTVEDRLFTAATLNVTTALADDLLSANFGKLEVDDLYKAAIFKIDGKFMAEMKATGYPNLTMEDLVKARIFKIDADYVREVRNMGFDKENFESLVKFRIFKVTPEYMNELRNEGLSDLDAEDVVKFRIFKIDAAAIREARAQDPNVTAEQIVQRRIHGKLKID